MKTLIKVGLLSVLTLFAITALSFGQNRVGKKARPSPNAAVSQTIGTTVVSITYGRPGLKGRSMESLAPAGKVWRTGANESVAITFSGDVMLGDKKVAAGTYSLYTIPGKDEWTIIINSKLSWGMRYDAAMDVARVKAAVSKGAKTEWFKMDFDHLTAKKAHLNLRWGTTVASIPITIMPTVAAQQAKNENVSSSDGE